MKNWALVSSNLPSCHRPIKFITEPRSGEVINLIGRLTRGKLLDNDTQLFIFISILIMTHLHPRDPENSKQNRFSASALLEKKKNPATMRVDW